MSYRRHCHCHRCCCHITWMNRSYQSRSAINSSVFKVGKSSMPKYAYLLFPLPPTLCSYFELWIRSHVGVAITNANISINHPLECNSEMIERRRTWAARVYDFQLQIAIVGAGSITKNLLQMLIILTNVYNIFKTYKMKYI